MTDVEVRWFVLPPSREADPWRSALLAHAAAKGVLVTEVVAGDEVVPADHIVLTSDLDIARLAGATTSTSAALRLPPFVDLSDCSGDDLPFRVLDLTRKIAAAHSFEGLQVEPGERLPAPFADLPMVEIATWRPSSLEEDFEGALAFLTQKSTWWPPTIFRYSSGPDTSGEPGVVDITGRPRLIVYGPYIFLTPGVWRSTVRLAFDEDAASKRYQLQWGGSESYAAHEFSPGRSGVFEISLDHEWTTHAATEIRLVLLEGALHGIVTFHGATVERTG